EAMEGPLALTECSHDHHQCGMAPKCGARSSWRLINDVVSEALRDVTRAQILPPLPLADDEQRRTIAVDVVS
ncbi:SUF system Fe-S cluster assembly regulator, partial [Enterococcus faecium]